MLIRSTRSRRGRRFAALGVALIVGLGLLAGCGDSDGGPSEPTYPVIINHKLGTTVIERAPQRIVALSDADLDALLVLGLQPVGIAESSGPDGVTAWAAPVLTSKPTVLTAGETGYNVEEVLALNPDLILAGGDYYIADEYQKYADVVPTTAFETGAFEDPWQTTLRQVAKAVGKSDRAEEIIEEVEGKIAKVKMDNPSLSGATFSMAQMWEAGSIGVLRSTEDTGVKMLGEFGMTLAPSLAALPGDELSVQLSLEQLGVLDADVLLTYYTEDSLKTTLEGMSTFQNLSVVSRGSYLALTLDQFSALRTPTPLSVGYLIDNVVPLIVKAAQAAP